MTCSTRSPAVSHAWVFSQIVPSLPAVAGLFTVTRYVLDASRVIMDGRQVVPPSLDDHSHSPVTGPPDAPAGRLADTVNVNGPPAGARLDRSSPSWYFSWMSGWWTHPPARAPGQVPVAPVGATDRNVHSELTCCTGRIDGFAGVGPSTTSRYVSAPGGSRNVGSGRLFVSGCGAISVVPRNRCTSLR